MFKKIKETQTHRMTYFEKIYFSTLIESSVKKLLPKRRKQEPIPVERFRAAQH